MDLYEDEDPGGDVEDPSSLLQIKSGTDWDLENAATALLMKDRQGVVRTSEKRDWLTDDQLERRRGKEIYNKHGTPDPELFRGMYRRAWNPEAGCRPTRHNHSYE